MAYPAASNEDWRLAVRRQAKPHRPKYPLEGPLYVEHHYYLKRPKKHFRSNGELRADAPPFPITKNTGDLDNYSKDTMDVLTELEFWGDDSQIVDARILKKWADTKETGAVLYIRQLNHAD